MKSVRQPAKVNVYLNNYKRLMSTFPNSPLLLRTGRFVISQIFSSHSAYKNTKKSGSSEDSHMSVASVYVIGLASVHWRQL
jgi:hypothetical protein